MIARGHGFVAVFTKMTLKSLWAGLDLKATQCPMRFARVAILYIITVTGSVADIGGVRLAMRRDSETSHHV
jgi:hypothetical protein